MKQLWTLIFFLWFSFTVAQANSIEIDAGLGGRTWLNKDNAENLRNLGGGYQLGISFPLKNNEMEFGLALAEDLQIYDKATTDKGVFVYLPPFLYLIDLPAALHLEEENKLWDFKIGYWHTVSSQNKMGCIQVGPAAHLLIFEKHLRTTASYPNFGSGALILTPHFQDNYSNSVSLMPGFSLGLRWKLYLGPAAIISGAEYILANPSSQQGVFVKDYQVKNLNNLNIFVQVGIPFRL